MERKQSVRIGLAAVAAAAVVATAISVPGDDGNGGLTLAAASELDKGARGLPHVDPPGAPPHSHSDPRTKNLVSRAGFEEGTQDPTTAVERQASVAYVESERALPDPQLVTVPAYPTRTAVPETRYAMAGGCYTIQAPSGAYVVRNGTKVSVASVPAAQAAGFYFKATRLGGYLVHTADGELASKRGKVSIAAKPSKDADWTVTRESDGTFRFRTLGANQALAVSGTSLVGKAVATPYRLEVAADACSAYPESQIDVEGDPHGGTTSYQEVRGYVDAHTHGMAFEFLGGNVHCGKPWDEYGAPYALVDCKDHSLTQGYGAIMEDFLSGETSHDPVGWPTFKDWPAPESLTHEGTYYRWLERAWRGGQRLFVNLLVENNKLCQLYPIKHNSCDDMKSIRLQAADMYEMQDYIDAQFGGPGLGFYRIVKTPYEARRVINAGKMAVVMGIETSIPFGCTFKETLTGKDRPACDEQEIDANLAEMKALGVRQMELVNKFDNALSGVAGDSGEIGILVNTANFLETRSFWQMEHCEPADGESHDNNQTVLPTLPEQDAIFGAIVELFGGALTLPALPVYPPPAHCNKRGLTDLGKHLIRELAANNMIFDPDHMSVKARQSSMDLIEELQYPGVLSSHSWSTPDTYPRIYRAGGFITPYAGDSTGFVQKWRRHLEWADPRYYWGIGFGADINGLGAQGDPRGADVPNPVTYPFTGINGVEIGQQHAGERIYDINVDGVAQYGLYPDWVQDLGLVADAEHAGDGAAIEDDMARGTEAYLQMWERADGIKPDSCRNPGLRKTVAQVQSLITPGLTTTQVMRRVGQPYERLGTEYGVCAKTAESPRVMVTIHFDQAGQVVSVTS
ncbi:hypothetical protein F0U44_05240 [Nocardioides humilatus]|uniref:Peptidase n=1 Tax=Nocardioides humilatus TaxID=2607660 RepID=A0A5B1LPH7_9ACTN|nr:hypothetical protein [Nocardioides humilatus]KAA1421680.1 hypothetical protein F0U44_05240 [Nocardioides humilatus]